MTLDTRFFIVHPDDIVDPEFHVAAFDEVCRLLGIPDRRRTTDEIKDGVRDIDNAPGQGFNAWVMSKSRADGSLLQGRSYATQCVNEEYPPEPGEEPECVDGSCSFCRTPPHHVEISMDTAYGYRDNQGRNCTTLHAHALIGMIQWTATFNGTLHWVNEYTGELNTGLNGFARFVGNGDEAQAWYHSVAAPAIAAQIAASQKEN